MPEYFGSTVSESQLKTAGIGYLWRTGILPSVCRSLMVASSILTLYQNIYVAYECQVISTTAPSPALHWSPGVLSVPLASSTICLSQALVPQDPTIPRPRILSLSILVQLQCSSNGCNGDLVFSPHFPFRAAYVALTTNPLSIPGDSLSLAPNRVLWRSAHRLQGVFREFNILSLT